MKKPTKQTMIMCGIIFVVGSYSIAITPYAYRSIKSDVRCAILKWASEQKDLSVFGSKVSDIQKAAEAIPEGIAINEPKKPSKK